MGNEAQGFAIALTAPLAQMTVLTGVLPPQTGFGSNDLTKFTAQYNLSEIYPTLLPVLTPDKTNVTAAVGFSSINNSDAFDEWTWAIDNVAHEVKDGALWLVIDIAAQGGTPDGAGGPGLGPFGPPTPALIFYGDVISSLSYHVTVITRA